MIKNALLITVRNCPFVAIAVHESEFLTIDQILDHYAELVELPRENMNGYWITFLDITHTHNGHVALMPFAKNPWKNAEA